MSTPQSTPVRHVKLGLASAKSLPLTNEYKRLLSEQHHRLTLKHQQDLDLLDDIRGYVKARLSIEKDYTNALQKLAKHHSNHINKKFVLLSQLDNLNQANEQHKMAGILNSEGGPARGPTSSKSNSQQSAYDNAGGCGAAKCEESKPASLYKVWCEHINRLHSTSKNRSEQFEQLIMIVDKLKDIRQHKASIGKKCLETHLKRIQEELLVSMVEVERAKKLYHEDESQARKARENEERIKKKRTGLLTKFTDLQAKKEKSSAQREATDIQSTQARNDYIMALAAANAHLNYYYHRDLNDFIQLIDDGVLDHCKIFMATLSECDINSLKDALQHAQHWSRLINLTGSAQTNCIFLNCQQSHCLRTKQELAFEACNDDPIQQISLDHNADYALQHEIDKWFTWFKKECRNLSQLMHQLDTCQHALAEGKKSIELNGQTVEDLEPKIVELKQQIRKCEAAKLKAQARLKVIKEGGMQIEEWSDVELEIRADMARAQEELERARRLKEIKAKSMEDGEEEEEEEDQEEEEEEEESLMQDGGTGASADRTARVRESHFGTARQPAVQLQISRNSDHDDHDQDDQRRKHEASHAPADSMQNLASVSRSTSNLLQKQQKALSGYSALTDPSLVWQDDYSSAWGAGAAPRGSVVMSSSFNEQPSTSIKSPTSPRLPVGALEAGAGRNQPLAAQDKHSHQSLHQHQPQQQQQQQQIPNANMSIQSSSPLSAIMNGGQHLSQSPYQVGIMSEAYKSDYECDYARTGHQASVRSAASSADPSVFQNRQSAGEELADEFGDLPAGTREQALDEIGPGQQDVGRLLHKRVIALYKFEKSNHDELAFDEHDTLVVTETNPEDTNWIRARLEATGEEGYIPSSYVSMVGDGGQPGPASDPAQEDQAEEACQSLDQPQTSVDESQQQLAEASALAYCRALYDYEPEENTFEEDGLPHLALRRGELMRVIDQGADDGWWLVEKEHDGRRGHVPSMLVQELEPDEEADGDALSEHHDLDDERDLSDREASPDEAEEAASRGPPPNFEAPVLSEDEAHQRQPASVEALGVGREQGAEPEVASTQSAANNSLVPTSFIIIEPTPEVESRSFEDDLEECAARKGQASHRGTPFAQAALDDESATGQIETNQQSVRQLVDSSGRQPPSGLNYSVVNEDFVLERPNRKPCQKLVSGSVEQRASEREERSTEELADGLERDGDALAHSSSSAAEGWPVPPSVVIDSVEAIPRSPDMSFDDESGQADEQEASGASAAADTDQSQLSDVSAAESVKKSIKHTGNVDVSPILRHHAEQFCKQLIEEAILLAPGSHIGPSTSCATGAHNDQTSANTGRTFHEHQDDYDNRRDYSFDDSS